MTENRFLSLPIRTLLPRSPLARSACAVVICTFISTTILLSAYFSALRGAQFENQNHSYRTAAHFLANELVADAAGSSLDVRALLSRYDAYLQGVAIVVRGSEGRLKSHSFSCDPEISVVAHGGSTTICGRVYRLEAIAPLEPNGSLSLYREVHSLAGEILELHSVAPWWITLGVLLPLIMLIAALLLYRGFIGQLQRLAVLAMHASDEQAPIRFPRYPLSELDSLSTKLAIATRSVRSRLAFLRNDDEQRKQMLHSLVHDIRTPYASIRGAVSLRETHQHDREKVQRYAAVIEAAVGTLTALAHSLRQLSSDTAAISNYAPTRFSIAELTNESILQLLPLAEAKAIRLSRGAVETGTIEADRVLLARALTNLLTNAIRYSEPGGEVQLSVSKDSELLTFSVQDRGPGIAPNELESLFSPFTQAEQGRRSGSGAGLGLSFVKNVGLLHGGDCSVTSELGAGSTFKLAIPQARAVIPLSRSEAAIEPVEQLSPERSRLRLYVHSFIAMFVSVLFFFGQDTATHILIALTIGVDAIASYWTTRKRYQFVLPPIVWRGLAYLLGMYMIYTPAQPLSVLSLGLYLGSLSMQMPSLRSQSIAVIGLFAVLGYRADGTLALGGACGLALHIAPVVLDSLQIARRSGLRLVGLLYIPFSILIGAQAAATWIASGTLMHAHAKGLLDQRMPAAEGDSASSPAKEFAIRAQLDSRIGLYLFDSVGTIATSSELVVNRESGLLDHLQGEPPWEITHANRIHPELPGGALRIQPMGEGYFGVTSPGRSRELLAQRWSQRKLWDATVLTLSTTIPLWFLFGLYIALQFRFPFSRMVQLVESLETGRMRVSIDSNDTGAVSDLSQAVSHTVKTLEQLGQSMRERVDERRIVVDVLARGLEESVALLQQQMLGEFGPDSKEYLERNEQLMELLLQLFKRQSTATRSQNDRFTTEELVYELEESLQAHYPAQQFVIDYSGSPLFIEADFASLCAVLQILLREIVESGSRCVARAWNDNEFFRLAIAWENSTKTLTSERLQLLSFLLQALLRETGGFVVTGSEPSSTAEVVEIALPLAQRA